MCPELAVVPVSSDGPPVTSAPITMVPEVVFLWVTCILRVGGGAVFVLHALRRASCACLPWLGLGRGLRAIRFCHSPSGKGTSGLLASAPPARPRIAPFALRVVVPLPERAGVPQSSNVGER